jgi:hypothetical protein
MSVTKFQSPKRIEVITRHKNVSTANGLGNGGHSLVSGIKKKNPQNPSG